MNIKQIKVARTVTNPEWISWNTGKYFEGELAFTMDQIGDLMFIQGSNTDTKEWYMSHFIVQITIGPRGGVKVKVCES